MQPLSNGRQSGFTLVEMLVSLAIFGMVGVVMLLGYRAIVPAWRHLEVRSDTGRQFELTAELIDRLVSACYPAVRGDSGNREVDFAGEAGRLEFLAPLSRRFGATALARYTILAGEQGQLQIASRLDYSESTAPDENDLVEETLPTPSSGIAFSYFGSADPSQPSKWQQSWVHQKTLPLLVRAHFVTGKSQIGAWPDITVAPRITADAACVYDATDGKCRAAP